MKRLTALLLCLCMCAPFACVSARASSFAVVPTPLWDENGQIGSVDLRFYTDKPHVAYIGINAFMAAVNNVISQYEDAQAQYMEAAAKSDGSKGVSVPSVYTKTIAMASNAGGLNAQKTVTYVVRGEVTASGPHSSTMNIYIEKVNMLTPVSGN